MMPQSPYVSQILAEAGALSSVSENSNSGRSSSIVRRYVGMQDLPNYYAPLFLSASRRSIFLSQPWFKNLERTAVDEAGFTRIYGVEVQQQGRENQPVCALLLRANNRSRWGILPRVFEGLSNYYTAYYGPILGSDKEDHARSIPLLAEALNEDRRDWDVLNLRPLDVNDSIYGDLCDSFRTMGMVVQTYLCFGNWFLKVEGRSYVEYLSGLSSVLRKNIPYATRRLERTAQVRSVLITSPEGLEQGLQDYERVYNVSWRGKAEPYPGFIPGLAQTAVEQGWLRLGLLYLDNEPAAAQLWLTHAGIASIYKICYDERFSKLSVGTVLTAKMMKQAIDVDKVNEVDYLGGDESYKSAWMSNRRERWGIVVFNPRTVRGLGQIFRHVGGRSVKRYLQRLMPGEANKKQPDQEKP